MPYTAPDRQHAYHLFVIRTEDRDVVAAQLTHEGIGFGVHYPEAIHRMPAYQGLGFEHGKLRVSEEACRRVLSLPIYPGLETSAVDRVIQALVGSG